MTALVKLVNLGSMGSLVGRKFGEVRAFVEPGKADIGASWCMFAGVLFRVFDHHLLGEEVRGLSTLFDACFLTAR